MDSAWMARSMALLAATAQRHGRARYPLCLNQGMAVGDYGFESVAQPGSIARRPGPGTPGANLRRCPKCALTP